MGNFIHQVWVQGEDKLPLKFQENRKLWQEAFPDFEMILWDDKMAKEKWDDYAKYTEQCYHHATRCDLILARAIRDMGGIATGTDCTPNNIEALKSYMNGSDTMIVLTNGRKELSNGLQWCKEPNHPFWVCICKHQLRGDGVLLSKPQVNVATGPICYYECFHAHHWELGIVTAKTAFKTDWNNGWTNPNAFIDAGFEASWTK